MSERGTILLVDDNAALVDNLAEVLGDVGYAVKRAGSCAEARREARTGFDVALVDLRLPDGDGTALARELKEPRPDAQVILLTGHASTESAAAAVRAGAFAYLVKPVPPPDLLLTVEQAARRVQLTTESRELSRRAQRAEKLAAVGTLAAGLSHEIKNPLNAATLQLLVLERRLKRLPGIPEDIFEPLGIVQSEILRLSHFLDEFLQFSRPREMIRRDADLGQLIGRVVDLLAPQATAAQLKLEQQVAPVPAIAADEARLQQAIMNLMLNAIQATPAGGWVRATARPEGSDIVIVVEDSGPGIADAVRERIFEPFFTTKDAGTGLGLPLVHSIVQQHGGNIAVERGEVGGARFVVRLPVRAPPPSPVDG
jgi:signal transduction histidine kinase